MLHMLLKNKKFSNIVVLLLVLLITIGVFLKQHVILCASGTGSELFELLIHFHDIIIFYFILTIIILIWFLLFNLFTLKNFIHLIGFIHLIIKLAFKVFQFIKQTGFSNMSDLFYHLKELNNSLFKESLIFFKKSNLNSLDCGNVLKMVVVISWLWGSENKFEKNYTAFKKRFTASIFSVILEHLVIILTLSSIVIPSLLLLYMLDPNHGASFVPISDAGMIPMQHFSGLSLQDQKLFVGVFKNLGIISNESAVTLNSYVNSGINVNDELNFAYMYHISSNRDLIHGFPGITRIASQPGVWPAAAEVVDINRKWQVAALARAANMAHAQSAPVINATAASATFHHLLAEVMAEILPSVKAPACVDLKVFGNSGTIGNLVSTGIVKAIIPLLKDCLGLELSSKICITISPIVVNNISIADSQAIAHQMSLELSSAFSYGFNSKLSPVTSITVASTVANIKTSEIPLNVITDLSESIIMKMNNAVKLEFQNKVWAITISPLVDTLDFTEIIHIISEDIRTSVRPEIMHILQYAKLKPTIAMVFSPVIVTVS